LHYHNDKELIAYGLITDIIENKKINFNFNFENGSFCSPIISLKNYKVIGIHYGESNKNRNNLNYGIYIIYIIIKLFSQNFNSSDSSIMKKIGIGAAITGGVIAGAALLPITLGFGTAGIVGGSIAAGIQAAIGNVAAGSLFAASTSLGMTGAFASTSAVGTILGAGGSLTAYLNSSFNPENDSILINNFIKVKDNPIIINELANAIIKILESRNPS